MSIKTNGVDSVKEYNSIINSANVFEHDYNKISLQVINKSKSLENEANLLNCQIKNMLKSLDELKIVNDNEEKRANEKINAIDQRIKLSI